MAAAVRAIQSRGRTTVQCSPAFECARHQRRTRRRGLLLIASTSWSRALSVSRSNRHYYCARRPSRPIIIQRDISGVITSFSIWRKTKPWLQRGRSCWPLTRAIKPNRRSTVSIISHAINSAYFGKATLWGDIFHQSPIACHQS